MITDAENIALAVTINTVLKAKCRYAAHNILARQEHLAKERLKEFQTTIEILTDLLEVTE